MVTGVSLRFFQYHPCVPSKGVQHEAKTGCTGCVEDIDCDDGNACTKDVCTKATGKCAFSPQADGASCADGNKCDGDETCG